MYISRKGQNIHFFTFYTCFLGLFRTFLAVLCILFRAFLSCFSCIVLYIVFMYIYLYHFLILQYRTFLCILYTVQVLAFVHIIFSIGRPAGRTTLPHYCIKVPGFSAGPLYRFTVVKWSCLPSACLQVCPLPSALCRSALCLQEGLQVWKFPIIGQEKKAQQDCSYVLLGFLPGQPAGNYRSIPTTWRNEIQPHGLR